MKKSLSALLLTLALAASLQGATRVIPVAGHLPGGNNTTWTTDLSLTNDDSVTNSVELVFHSDAGVTRSRSVTLAGRQSLLLDDAVRPDRFGAGNPESWIGQLEVRSGGHVSASARIFTTGGGGTYGSTYESFDPTVLATSGAMAGLVNSSRYRTNVAYSNPSDGVASINYTVRREDGGAVAVRQLNVAAHSTVQIPLSRDSASTSDDSRLLVEWSSSLPAYSVASLVDNHSNDPTNIPSTIGDTSFFFPAVGKTAGGLSTFWRTSLTIGSRADVSGSVTLAYRDSASGRLFTATFPLPARGSIKADDLNAALGAPNGSGSLSVTSTVRVVASVRVFNTQADDSTYGSSVLSQDDSVRSSRVRIKGVRRDSAFRLNIAISGNSGATDGSVRLFDDNGREVEVEPFHLEHDSMIQLPLSRGEVEVHAGEVEVETHNGVSVTVVASNVDNRTGDTSVHESEQENERQQEIEIRISPSTAVVNTPVTFTIGNGSNVASVAWNFGDGSTGSGLTTTHTFSTAGEFDVNAVVTLVGGAIVRSREDIHILASDQTPSNGPIDFDWSPVNPAPGQSVTFTASRTTSGGTFKWKFPGDVRVTGGVATFVFAAAGSYEVELELEHEGATTLHVAHIINIGNGGNNGGGGTTPLDFTWSPASPAAGQQVTFTASGGNGGTLTFKFPGDIRMSGSAVTFTFASAGSFQVELEQEKEGSTTLHVTHVVNVGGGSNGGGTAATSVDFSYSPSSPRAGQTVTFSATADRQPPAGSFFRWRMPDDSRPEAQSTTYTFATAGSYRVRVQLEQPGLPSIEQEKTIVVAP